jgi:hypothetical protein
MWRRVDFVRTDVSEECITSIFIIEKSASEKPACAGGCRLSRQSKSIERRGVRVSGEGRAGSSPEPVYDRVGVGGGRPGLPIEH